MMTSSKLLREDWFASQYCWKKLCLVLKCVFAYLEMVLWTILYKLSNISRISNLEVRWNFLFQEPVLTEVYSELKRHSSKPLMVIEGSPRLGEWNQTALNLIIGEFIYYPVLASVLIESACQTVPKKSKWKYLRHHQPVLHLSQLLWGLWKLFWNKIRHFITLY